MLTSFFGKSNPVNYLLLGIFILVSFVYAFVSDEAIAITWSTGITGLLIAMGCVFAMLLLDFIIRKNDLTERNTFAIFLFSCFLISFPAIFINAPIVIANIFVMLALRRIFSLPSNNNTEKKILDATIFIGLASLFYFPSIFFIAFLFLAIIQMAELSFRWLLIPIVGLLVVVMLTTAYYILLEDSAAWWSNWIQPISFDFSVYHAIAVLIPITIISAIMFWTGAHLLLRLGSLAKKEKPRGFLLLLLTVVSLVVCVFSPLKTGAEVLFLITPTAMLAANYIGFQQPNNQSGARDANYWFKEILLWIVLLLPCIGLLAI